MPLQLPNLDDRRYQQLRDEALARMPVHNPEWTNFNESDPGVTLVELFAFMTENLLYRANQIPERNRRKFLSLLGVPLRPASSARGLVAFSNERGPLETITLDAGLEVRAGQVPFRTERGLDVLPVEAQRLLQAQARQPGAAGQGLLQTALRLVLGHVAAGRPSCSSTRPCRSTRVWREGVSVGEETVDGSLWIALLAARDGRPRRGHAARARRESGRQDAEPRRRARARRGNAPADAGRRGRTGGRRAARIPDAERTRRTADCRRRPTSASRNTGAARERAGDVLAAPGVVEITLPPAPELRLWNNLDPLESGVGDFPPALEDTNLNDRLITWLRVRSSAAVRARLLWVGINTTFVAQRARVSNELLPDGHGRARSDVGLARTPVMPDSVRLLVTAGNETRQWWEMDDLLSAGPEVPALDARVPPGTRALTNSLVKVFALDAESGELRFGDGMRGKRPPAGATLRADYDYGVGARGQRRRGLDQHRPCAARGLQGDQSGPHLGRRGRRDRRRGREADQRATCSIAIGSSPPRTSRRSRCARRAWTSAASM